MSVISVEDLTFSYGSDGDYIFRNVSFRIDTDWKLGFIGRNGRGKTTFLRLLMGEYEYSGRIVSSVGFEYFPRTVRNADAPVRDVLAEICPAAEEWQVIRELNCLDVDCECLDRPFATLSGGERTKALLAAMFLCEDKFLLIDEPTNHLDARARKLLADYLKRKKSFILVSHDRELLDGCVDHVLSLNRANIDVQSGNWSSFMTNFERRQACERKENARLQKDIARLRETAARTFLWADATEASKNGRTASGLKPDKGYVGHKSAKMMKRAKAVEARSEREAEQKSALLRNTETEADLKLSPLTYRSERLISLSGVSPVYDGRAVCLPVTLDVMRGDRIAIDGKNGSGKSSLLKLLCGEAVGHTGRADIGSGLVISYIPQDISHLSGTLAELASASGTDESLLKAVLHKMGVESRQFDKDISGFSDGQKKKILLAKSLCERAHLYIWDEPLNYVDIYTRVQIEEVLRKICPTMIFVEHDGAFRDRIATRVVKL